MPRAKMILASILLASASPPQGRAQDSGATRASNALDDLARAQPDRAGTLRRTEELQRDQARAAGAASQNAEVMSRSLRMFDYR
jgi:hypothetical protein